MSKLKDMTGQRFGKLIVLEKAASKGGRTMWLCKCDCGGTKIVSRVDLSRGATKSCGCYRKSFRVNNLIGQKFGKLLVVEKISNNAGHGSLWKCQCDCGNTVNVRCDGLKSGHTTSCGCYVKSGKPHIRHGLTHSRIHRTWNSMKQRCGNPNFKQYKDYGGRGIKVCDDWKGKYGFDKFYQWAICNGYSDDLEIDRIDNNGNYEPSNCRFVTHKENMNNRKR